MPSRARLDGRGGGPMRAVPVLSFRGRWGIQRYRKAVTAVTQPVGLPLKAGEGVFKVPNRGTYEGHS